MIYVIHMFCSLILFWGVCVLADPSTWTSVLSTNLSAYFNLGFKDQFVTDYGPNPNKPDCVKACWYNATCNVGNFGGSSSDSNTPFWIDATYYKCIMVNNNYSWPAPDTGTGKLTTLKNGPAGDQTWAAWIYYTGSTASYYAGRGKKKSTCSGTTCAVFMGIDGSRQPFIDLNLNGVMTTTTATSVTLPTSWTGGYVAWTYNATMKYLTLYLNGCPRYGAMLTAAADTINSANIPFYFMNDERGYPTGAFTGGMQHLGIWARWFNDTDMWTLYQHYVCHSDWKGTAGLCGAAPTCTYCDTPKYRGGGTTCTAQTACTGDSTGFTNGNGGNCTSNAYYPYVCNMACNTGYYLSSGIIYRFCYPNQTLSAKPTGVCSPVSCPGSSVQPTNGNEGNCSTTTLYPGTCLQACNMGYYATPSTLVRSCTQVTPGGSAGVYSTNSPNCAAVTCAGDSLVGSNGAVGNCTTSTTYPGTCLQTCITGYQLSTGSLTRACTHVIGNPTGSYANPTAQCVRITCNADTTNPTGGSAGTCATSTIQYQSTCTMSCNSNYNLTNGSFTRTCQSDKSFSPMNITCTAFCPWDNYVLGNGSNVNCTNGILNGQSCKFQCNSGYQASGSLTRTCSTTGVWSSIGTCAPINCTPDGVIPVNGTAGTCGSPTPYLLTCNVSCASNYNLSGNPVRNCLANGSLTASTATCIAQCPGNASLYGANSTTGNCTNSGTANQKCFPGCTAGYNATGAQLYRTCQQNTATWSLPSYTCTPVICPGSSQGPVNGSAVTCSSDVTFPNNCTLTCSPGYTQTAGYLTRQCQSDMSLTPIVATCTPVTCTGDSTAPQFGTSGNCNNNIQYPQTCSQQCQSGYGVTQGSLTRSCLTNGSLSVSNAACSAGVCTPDLQGPTNGNPGNCNVSVSQAGTCDMQCNPGYLPSGSLTRTCQANGSLSYYSTLCLGKTCNGDSATVSNGTNGNCSNSVIYPGVCQQQCNTGYQETVPGSLTRQCQTSGSYVSSTATCTPVTCPSDSTAPLNGIPGTCNTAQPYLSVCQVDCNNGYTLQNGASRTCQANATWTPITATCVGNTCSGDSTLIGNGTAGNCTNSQSFPFTCEQQCNDGYELTGGNLTRQCQANSTYGLSTAVCTGVICPGDSTGPQFGSAGNCSSDFSYPLTCKLQCNLGYIMVGSGIRTCYPNRTLSSIDSTCHGSPCTGDSTVPPNTDVGTCSISLPYPGVCQQECLPGYELTGGNLARNCLTNGSYSWPTAVCTAKTCPGEFYSPVDGQSGNCSTDLSYPEICQLGCDAGYMFDNGTNGIRYCTESGLLSANNDSCVGIPCVGDTDTAPFSTSNCSNPTIYPGYCVQKCDDGYTPIGPTVRHCDYSTGQYEQIELMCIGVVCPGDPTVQNNMEDINCSAPAIYPDSCIQECQLGYVNGGGSLVRRCLASGSYEPVQAFCSAGLCPGDTSPVSHGSQGTCNVSVPYPMSCDQECDAGYKLNGGNLTRHCQANSTLEDSTAMCENPCEPSNWDNYPCNWWPCEQLFSLPYYRCECDGCHYNIDCTGVYAIPPLTLSIVAPSQSYLSSTLYLSENIVYPADCWFSYDPPIQATYVYDWEKITGPGTSIDLGTSADVSYPPGALPLGDHTFQLTVVVKLKDNSAQSILNATTVVTVIRTPLVVAIVGGNRQVQRLQLFQLDGTLSNDPDTKTNSQLTFQWDCINSQNLSCPGFSTSQQIKNTAILSITQTTANAFIAGDLTFTLTVTDPASGRTGNASVIITIVEIPIPQVQIVVPNPPYLPQINPGDTLRLLGVIDPNYNGTYNVVKWTEDNIGLNLDNPLYRASDPYSLSLVYNPGLFIPLNIYHIVLTIDFGGTNLIATPSIDILVRNPPVDGNCTVSPSKGTAFVTNFNLNCFGWIDPVLNSSLEYSFGYYYNNTIQESLLSTQKSLSSYTAVLPPGNFTFIAHIYNNINGSTLFKFGQVIVTSNQTMNDCTIQNLTNTLLVQAQALKNTDSIIQLVTNFMQLMLNDNYANKQLNVTVSCQSNDTLAEFRTKLWIVFLQGLNQTTQASRITDLMSLQLANTLLNLTTALYNTSYLGIQTTAQQSEVTDLVISILRVIVDSISSRSLVSDSVLLVFSQLLQSIPCAFVQIVLDLMSLLARNALQDTIPDENFVEFVAPRVNSTGIRLYSNSSSQNNSNVSINGLEFQFNPDLLARGAQAKNGTPGYINSAFVDVTVTRYDQAVRRCRDNPNQTIVGDILSIELSSAGQLITVGNLTNAFVFYLPVDNTTITFLKDSNGCIIEKKPTCSYWDVNTSMWKTDGCITGKTTTLTTGGNAVECACSHLTDFTLLLAEVKQEGTCNPVGIYRLPYQILAAIYLAVGVLCLVQIIRVSRSIIMTKRYSSTGGSRLMKNNCCGWNPLLQQHASILMVCLFRALTSAKFGDIFDLPLPLAAVVTAIPYAIMFWIFTSLVFEWANIIHLSVRDVSMGKRKMRPLFIICNVIVSSMFLAFLVSIAMNKKAEEIALIASIVVSVVYFITGGVFLVYGTLLARQLVMGGIKKTSTSAMTTATTHLKSCTLAARIQLSSFFVSCCFLAESIIWFMSVLRPENLSLDIAFRCMDIFSLVVVIGIFWKAVSRAVEEATRKDEPLNDVSVNGMEDENSHKSKTTKNIGGSSKSSKQEYTAITPQQSFIRLSSQPNSPMSSQVLQPLNSETQMVPLSQYPSSPDLIPYEPPGAIGRDEREPFIPADERNITPENGGEITDQNDNSGTFTPAPGTPEKSPTSSSTEGVPSFLIQSSYPPPLPPNIPPPSQHPSISQAPFQHPSISQASFRFTQSSLPSNSISQPTPPPIQPTPPQLPNGWSGSSPTYSRPPPPIPPPLPSSHMNSAPQPPPLPSASYNHSNNEY